MARRFVSAAEKAGRGAPRRSGAEPAGQAALQAADRAVASAVESGIAAAVVKAAFGVTQRRAAGGVAVETWARASGVVAEGVAGLPWGARADVLYAFGRAGPLAAPAAEAVVAAALRESPQDIMGWPPAIAAVCQHVKSRPDLVESYGASLLGLCGVVGLEEEFVKRLRPRDTVSVLDFCAVVRAAPGRAALAAPYMSQLRRVLPGAKDQDIVLGLHGWSQIDPSDSVTAGTLWSRLVDVNVAGRMRDDWAAMAINAVGRCLLRPEAVDVGRLLARAPQWWAWTTQNLVMMVHAAARLEMEAPWLEEVSAEALRRSRLLPQELGMLGMSLSLCALRSPEMWPFVGRVLQRAEYSELPPKARYQVHIGVLAALHLGRADPRPGGTDRLLQAAGRPVSVACVPVELLAQWCQACRDMPQAGRARATDDMLVSSDHCQIQEALVGMTELAGRHIVSEWFTEPYWVDLLVCDVVPAVRRAEYAVEQIELG